MVDAAVADPRPAREFSRRVDRFLGGEGGTCPGGIDRTALPVEGESRKVRAIVERSPMLQEIETPSEALSNAAALGLEALDILAGKKETRDVLG